MQIGKFYLRWFPRSRWFPLVMYRDFEDSGKSLWITKLKIAW